MNPEPVIVAMDAILERLRPTEFEHKLREYRRAGLPGQSIPEGSRSSEHGIPGFDKDDRMLNRASKDYHRHLRLALKELQAAERVELSVTQPAERPKEAPECSNVFCQNRVEAGRDSGECGRCRVARHRSGKAWEPKSEVTDVRLVR